MLPSAGWVTPSFNNLVNYPLPVKFIGRYFNPNMIASGHLSHEAGDIEVIVDISSVYLITNSIYSVLLVDTLAGSSGLYYLEKGLKRDRPMSLGKMIETKIDSRIKTGFFP